MDLLIFRSPFASGVHVSVIRTSLLTILPTLVFLSHLSGAVDHPLYFEERSNGVFETRTAGQSVVIRPDRIELDGVSLRFVHPSRKAHLEGLGTPAPGTYITRGLTRTFRQFPKAVIRRLYP
jgi:hypothetical protein